MSLSNFAYLLIVSFRNLFLDDVELFQKINVGNKVKTCCATCVL